MGRLIAILATCGLVACTDHDATVPAEKVDSECALADGYTLPSGHVARVTYAAHLPSGRLLALRTAAISPDGNSTWFVAAPVSARAIDAVRSNRFNSDALDGQFYPEATSEENTIIGRIAGAGRINFNRDLGFGTVPVGDQVQAVPVVFFSGPWLVSTIVPKSKLPAVRSIVSTGTALFDGIGPKLEKLCSKAART